MVYFHENKETGFRRAERNVYFRKLHEAFGALVFVFKPHNPNTTIHATSSNCRSKHCR